MVERYAIAPIYVWSMGGKFLDAMGGVYWTLWAIKTFYYTQ